MPHAPTLYAWLKAWEVHAPEANARDWLPFSLTAYGFVPAVDPTLIGALNGYVIAKWRFRGSEFIWRASVRMFYPISGYFAANGAIASDSRAGEYGDRSSIVHVIYGIAFTTLFFRNFYVSVPTELVKAAQPMGPVSSKFLGTYFCLYLYRSSL